MISYFHSFFIFFSNCSIPCFCTRHWVLCQKKIIESRLKVIL
ncbi:hypothetical protein ACB092_08G021000 [Castanea dentata]